ncbi:MAG: penicillin-binding protein, partial [Roseococcus sp.]
PPRLPPGAAPALPLALGGAGLTLREMVVLYALLGRGGDGIIESRAAGLAMRLLVQGFPQGGPPGIAWKTGTSWGGRDAWALGVDGRHVVGVWVGRPDGTAMPGATGARLALPLLAQLFALLPPAPLAPLPLRPAPLADRAPADFSPADPLRLAFPPPGAVLEEGGRVVLRAQGGQRPLTFLVNGAPLPGDPARRDRAWTPPGPGFYRITVLDAQGAAARSEVRVR